MQLSKSIANPPSLPAWLFWDTNIAQLNWNHAWVSVIVRVLEKGNDKHFEEIVKYYGRSKILDAVQNKIKFLPEYAIDFVCQYFSLDKQDLACYNHKNRRPGHWL